MIFLVAQSSFRRHGRCLFLPQLSNKEVKTFINQFFSLCTGMRSAGVQGFSTPYTSLGFSASGCSQCIGIACALSRKTIFGLSGSFHILRSPNRPQRAKVLLIGTPEKGPLISGNHQILNHASSFHCYNQSRSRIIARLSLSEVGLFVVLGLGV